MRAARLRRTADIAAVRAEGRSLRKGAFNARVRRTGGTEIRIAVTASRQLGSAVARNRARRRVREAFRRAVASGGAGLSMDVLITVRPEARATEFRTIEAEALSTLRQVLP
jgi:ribonuclease P protein component